MRSGRAGLANLAGFYLAPKKVAQTAIPPARVSRGLVDNAATSFALFALLWRDKLDLAEGEPRTGHGLALAKGR